MGCDGSGRGPPGGTDGRIGGGYDGRCGAGRVDTPPGPPPGPPGLARFPVAGGSGAVGLGGTILSEGRSRGPAGRVGIAGTADVPGALGSSILSRMLGGTIRPGAGICLTGAAGAAATGRGGAGAPQVGQVQALPRPLPAPARPPWRDGLVMEEPPPPAPALLRIPRRVRAARPPVGPVPRRPSTRQPASRSSRAAAAQVSGQRAWPVQASCRRAPASWRPALPRALRRTCRRRGA